VSSTIPAEDYGGVNAPNLEVAFLFPWAVAFREVGAFGFWSMMIFLGVLTVGFIYEWRKGALEWD
jgi:NADH-quinone oxidoreductase subunit A